MLFISFLLTFCAIQGLKNPVWNTQAFDEGLSVSTPVPLVDTKYTNSDPKFSSVKVYGGSTASYALGVSVGRMKDISASQTSVQFSSAAKYLSTTPGAVVVGVRDVLLQGYPGQAITVSQNGGATFVARNYRFGGMFASLFGFYRSPGSRPPEIDRFLDSLHFSTTGPLTMAGPELTRYPLGDSGLSALFPRQPDHKDALIGTGSEAGTIHAYTSDYGLRSFMAGYGELPSTPAKSSVTDVVSKARQVTDALLAIVHGKVEKQRTEQIGSDQGLYTQFVYHEQARGSVLVYVHSTRIIIVIEYAPKVYEDSKTVEAFLHSVEPKS